MPHWLFERTPPHEGWAADHPVLATFVAILAFPTFMLVGPAIVAGWVRSPEEAVSATIMVAGMLMGLPAAVSFLWLIGVRMYTRGGTLVTPLATAAICGSMAVAALVYAVIAILPESAR